MVRAKSSPGGTCRPASIAAHKAQNASVKSSLIRLRASGFRLQQILDFSLQFLVCSSLLPEAAMGATSDDLMDIARAGAERIDMPDKRIRFPSFSDIEEQCATEYDELLDALHEDELFAPADVQRQEEIVQRLKDIVRGPDQEL